MKPLCYLSLAGAATLLAGLTLADEQTGPLPPHEALASFTVPDDLAIDQVLTEPLVRQPVFLNFDERGRLWVVEYLQYPNPAGLKMLSHDKYWRAVYDRVPAAAPNDVPGADKITIHEDTDGDGAFDRHKTFVDGLNIATACVRGRGGVWVLNPPYLLFYPDRDNDDVPDGDPEVRLEGFGLEDTHSVVNSLQWGPDGWLYAAQGSTVTARVKRPGDEGPGVFSQGQLVWRYHPDRRQYEIFAEGGGNAFGIEIDSKGRIFSGHNGGNTRGFYYVQGSYSQKGFSKHGPLSNPYAFGYFKPMHHHDVPRFTHTFVIYEGDGLPERYHGLLFGVAPLLNHVVMSKVIPDGSTFRTEDVGHAITSTDPWFRPVDIKLGPDGALYIADWYDGQINHYRNHEGHIDPQNGRVYRLKPKSTARPSDTLPATAPFDLSRKTTDELIDLLRHPNKWQRRTALRLIGDRKDRSILPRLKQIIETHTDQLALEVLWALYQTGGFDEEVALKTLEHGNPYVRLWTARLLGDDKQVTEPIAVRLAQLAAREPNIEVRSQLAATAKRLPAAQGLPIVRGLLTHDEDVADPHVPLLLWWAIESKCASDAENVLAMFEDTELWRRPLVAEHILERLMRRFALAGTRKDLLACARLLQLAPDAGSVAPLTHGFELAFQGRTLAGVPDELIAALERAGGGSRVLDLRQGKPEAVAEALKTVADPSADPRERLEYVQVFGEIDQPACVPVLLVLLRNTNDEGLQTACLASLGRYGNPEVGQAVVDAYSNLGDDPRAAAGTLLASRAAWTRRFLDAVAAGRIDRESVPLDLVRKMTVHPGDKITEAIARLWGNVEGATTEVMQQQIERLHAAVEQGTGDPYRGKKLFTETCAKCHVLFGEGGRIGPDLTSYQRRDLSNMLLAIVNPSAEIREGFENFLVLTNDGRAVSGFLAEQNNRVVVLRGADGQDLSVPRDAVDEMRPQAKSIMPEGLLAEFTDEQVRDLFAYLRSTQPLNE